MQEQINTTDRKIVNITKVVIEYDFSRPRSIRWAKRINRKLTNKEFEIEKFEPGRVTYEKRKVLNGS